MALIKCPECGKEISDISEVCVQCGYPIKAEVEKKRKEEMARIQINDANRRTALIKRINQAKSKGESEEIKEYIAIGDGGYYLGYTRAGKFYLDRKEWDKALLYCKKAIELNAQDPENTRDSASMINIGQIYKNIDSGYFNPEKAIEYFLKANDPIAYNNLATLYSPSIKLKGLEKYWDVDKAISYYVKAIDMGCDLPSAFWNLADLFAAFKHEYVFAAVYAYFAKKKGSPSAQRGYGIFKEKVIQEYGIAWIKSIESLSSPKSADIDAMVKRVNDEVESSKIRCPYCRSTNVVKITLFRKAISLSMFGLASSKAGKEWHCNSCDSNF